MTKKEKHIKEKSFGGNIPFRTPDDYFDTFSDRLMDRIDTETKLSAGNKIVRFVRPALALAASFVLIFFLIYVPVKTFGPKTAINETELNDQEFLDYYYINDHVVFNTFEDENQEEYNEALMETVLLASVSDIELLDI